MSLCPKLSADLPSNLCITPGPSIVRDSVAINQDIDLHSKVLCQTLTQERLVDGSIPNDHPLR